MSLPATNKAVQKFGLTRQTVPAPSGDRLTLLKSSGKTQKSSGIIPLHAVSNDLKEHIQRFNDSGYFTPSPHLSCPSSSGTDSGSRSSQESSSTYSNQTPFLPVPRSRISSLVTETASNKERKTVFSSTSVDRLRVPRRVRPNLVPKQQRLAEVVGTTIAATSNLCGFKYVDFVRQLHDRNMQVVTTEILDGLEPRDLGAASCVSRAWRRACYTDRMNNQRQRLFVERMRVEKENGIPRDRPQQPVGRSPFKPIREMTNLPIPVAPKVLFNNETHSQNFRRLLEMAPTLKPDDKLDKCPRCYSPARVFQPSHHTVCSRISCAFDFCTECRCSFIGHRPCSPYEPSMPFASIKPGAARRNLRRL